MRYRAMVAAAMLMVSFVGCATTKQIETQMLDDGNVDALFFHIAKEADARGFQTERDTYFDTLSIWLDAGRLDYVVHHDRVMLEITVSSVGLRTEDQEDRRAQTLRSLSQELTEAAHRRMAARADRS